jgi:S1-C subfamily serine protease
MFRGLVLAVLFVAADLVQPLGVLRIKVVVEDGAGQATAVPRHLLLISDNPSSAPPRRLFTSVDGSVEVRLAPGNYTVESDKPLAFEGKAYHWTQLVDVVAGRDTVLELTAANAEVETLTAEPASAAAPIAADPESLLIRWLDSVVPIWSPTTRASGVVIDANGLIVTNQRVIGTATSVEVQFTPTLKVAATVLAADPARDVAVLRIDPSVATSARPLPLNCGVAAPPLADGQEIFSIEAPLRRQKGTSSGIVTGLSPNEVVSDLIPAFGGDGGPVFVAGGTVIGISSPGDEDGDSRREKTRVVRLDDVCRVVATAETKVKDAAPPKATLLPVEPVKALPVDALKEMVRRRAGSLNPYEMTSTDFVLAFMTPLHVYAAQGRLEAMGGRSSGGSQPAGATPSGAVTDFGNWSEYVADVPPVLLIRVTPKLVEGFWTKVARGAAMTKGIPLPPFKRPKSGFARMRAFCGDTEIAPIHPLKIEHRVSGTETIYEGLYAFDPGALPPTCGSVRLILYSEKEPVKPDTQIVDGKLVEQIWNDLAPYRAP